MNPETISIDESYLSGMQDRERGQVAVFNRVLLSGKNYRTPRTFLLENYILPRKDHFQKKPLK